MRYWDNKEVPGRGTKFCLVMDPEDGTNPIKTYGWSMEEVLDKVAKTAETAQQVINRQRSTPPAAAKPAGPVAVVTKKRLTADEIMQHTSDLQNPGKSREAIKALLGDVGVDVDRMKLEQDARQAGAVAQEWERNHPEFPSDERNQRTLMDKALLMANGQLGLITAQILDSAFQELQAQGRLFEPADDHEPANGEQTPPNAPDGNSATVVRPRGATSYRKNALRSPATTAQPKPKYTRADIDGMNSRVLRDKIEHEPGFRELVNSYSQPA